MASITNNKLFHTYENVGYDDQPNGNHAVPTMTANNIGTALGSNSGNIDSLSINKNAVESPFTDPLSGKLRYYASP